MAISNPLSDYLNTSHIDYDVLMHKHTTNAIDTAYSAQIPMQSLAKAVLLEDSSGNYLMAAVPCQNKLNLKRLKTKLSKKFNLASEAKLKQLFDDCEPGAIPALGQPYKIPTICDDSLLEQSCVYIEGGDHQALLKFSQDQFCRLLGDSPHDIISKEITHPHHPA
ncbi:MAG: YbaK/EbsC family protein [Motiliproteus sp.]